MSAEPHAQVGEYQLGEVLPSGSWGRTHAAIHVPSGRVVALTLLTSVAGDPVATQLFREDLPVIAAIHHPNVLRVEDWGEAYGVPYVVTALSRDQTLAVRLAQGSRFGPAAALGLLRQVAAAIDAAH